MHIYSNRQWSLRCKALRKMNRRTGVRNYSLSQRTLASKGRRDRIILHLFPVGQTPSREEVS